MCKNWPELESGGASLAKKPCPNTRTGSHLGGRKFNWDPSESSADSRKKGAMGNGVPDMLQSTTSSLTSSSVMQVGTLPKFHIGDQGGKKLNEGTSTSSTDSSKKWNCWEQCS